MYRWYATPWEILRQVPDVASRARTGLMGERVCRYCQRSFQPSKFQPAQTACSDPDCQRRRRNDYHRRKVATDPVYRQVCQESAQQWRAEHPDYWAQLREHNPAPPE